MEAHGVPQKLTAILSTAVVGIAARLESLADAGGICISKPPE